MRSWLGVKGLNTYKEFQEAPFGESFKCHAYLPKLKLEKVYVAFVIRWKRNV